MLFHITLLYTKREHGILPAPVSIYIFIKSYSNGITEPSYVLLMYSLIVSDVNTAINALISALFSFPSFTAITFTYV